MNYREIRNFYEEEYKQQAQNKNYQSIASYIDGLKPTARKVIHTVLKNNVNSWTKNEVLANKTAGETEYLGGASNIYGVIVTIAKGYATSNNIPMLDTNGNFGQRLDNKPGEARYIKVRKLAAMESYFSKEDQINLVEQVFEGTVVEPRFFVPSVPFILINGSEGMGSGHAQKIMPRSEKVVRSYIKSKLTGKGRKPQLVPSWNGFNGKVYQGDADHKWVTEGLYELNRRQIIITELPVGYELAKYLKVLDDLVDAKTIKSYVDQSDTKSDTYRFIVNVDTKFDLDHDNIIKTLKLYTKIAENYTCMDENNKITVFKTPAELMDRYIGIKLEYMQKRKDSIIAKYDKNIDELMWKYKFIDHVTKGNIVINKQTKPKIVKQIESYPEIGKVDDSYDYLLRMPIYSLTQEKMKELSDKIKALKAELAEIKKTTIEDMWLKEI